MWDDAQIRSALHEMLIDVLAVEPDELTPDARFFEDLGGESIDVLELGFMAEKRFGRPVDFQRMVAADALELDPDRRLTAASIEKLGAAMPSIDLEALRQDPRVDSLRDLLTVENLYLFLRQTVQVST